jgi:hypothetical protein
VTFVILRHRGVVRHEFWADDVAESNLSDILSGMPRRDEVSSQQFRLGSAGSVERFRTRCSGFFEGSAALEHALALAFKREFSGTDDADAMIFFLGSRCEEDFREIGLLAANGHGWGATAHLRGMYERAVAAAYLHAHPEEVDAFWEFDFIRRWRTAQKIKETFNINAEDETRLAELKANYDAVVDRFRITDCSKCKSTRINGAWHKLHFVAMAGTVGQLGRLIVPAYYMPLAQAHGTFASATYRFSESHDGSFFIDQSASEDEAARSFRFAHLTMLAVLTIQNERFAMPELDEALGSAWQHYKVGWGVGESEG